MRNAFANTMLQIGSNPSCFFLTGDLGFMALEEVRKAMGPRFINCGVAEQNMIGIAAGLAREGMRVFAYSIAPFCYARPFEQIRNDIAFTRLPVCLVGNGGGYAYGHMGPTHHALEDCAVMTAINIRALVPAFDEDIHALLQAPPKEPCYLRLGYDVRPHNTAPPGYAPWRCVLSGQKGVMAALGPLAGLAWKALQTVAEHERPAVWAVTELPLAPIPQDFQNACTQGKPLYIIEEHDKNGGLGMQLLYSLTRQNILPTQFFHNHAAGYLSGTYGSQTFHRKECGLDETGILQLVLGAV